jgi:hypothetical protein
MVTDAESIPQNMRLNNMPLCFTYQLRRTGLTLGAALLFTVGAPHSLHAQLDLSSPLTSSSNESAAVVQPLPASELPDAPGALLYPQAGQNPAPNQAPQTTPPTPQVTDNPYAVSVYGTQQTKRVLGIIPNFSSVSADTKLPPQTPKEKLVLAAKNSFDYSSFLVAGIQAGFAMDSKSYPEFGQGLEGYGKYYWHTLADTASENFFVGGIGPIVFKQDSRFYTLGHGGFRKRSWYAVTRVVVSRKDNGDPTFNFSEIVGSGASAGFSTLYYPQKYQTWTKVGQKWLTSDLIDGFNFWWKEWWPSVNKKVFHQTN